MGTDPHKPTAEKPSDPRVEGIGTVGWITLSALGISIPLTAIAGRYAGWLAVAIPLIIIIGAGIMAVRIWSSGETVAHQKQNEALKKQIQDLEARLANLELVDSLEAHFAEKHQQPGTEENPSNPTPTMGPISEKTNS